jgi:hypothetical protein
MIFSHVLYHLSYPAAQGSLAYQGTLLILDYETWPIKNGLVKLCGLLLREAVELEGGLEHLLGQGADDGLGLLTGFEEGDGRDA